MLACFVPGEDENKSVKRKHFVEVVWKFGTYRFTKAQKRQRDNTFLDLNPAKRGRKETTLVLQEKIANVWIEN